MTYRVYDKKERKWVEDNIFLSPNGGLFLIKKFLFGWFKTIHALSQERYVYYKDIALYDKDNKPIFEGDYLKAQVDVDKEVVGMVAYVDQLSAYVILCEDTNEFYTLGSDTSEFIVVIGNVLEGYEHN